MLHQKLEDLQTKYDKVENFVAVEAKLREELATTRDNLDQEKKDRRNEVNEKEREKIQVTEKLRKDMLYKIKETKANLLALNDEQLQTTTRLTILQNH
jgi:erythromycin esterase-like protein